MCPFAPYQTNVVFFIATPTQFSLMQFKIVLHQNLYIYTFLKFSMCATGTIMSLPVCLFISIRVLHKCDS